MLSLDKKIISSVLIVIVMLCLVFMFTACDRTDIEEATHQNLVDIDGIGSITANRVLSYVESGEVDDIDELLTLYGIDKKRLRLIKKVYK